MSTRRWPPIRSARAPNTAKTWKDVNPALPAIKIRVLGPPPTSGTRDSLVELYLTKGCESDPAMKELKKSDEDKHKDVCTKVREDGAFVEAGENDNLLVQKVAADEGTLGILGFSYLEENADKVIPVKIDGISPTEATIADLSYPGARKLYVYLKGEHLQAKPQLREFFATFAKMWAKGGALERIGLVPFGDAEAGTRRQAGDRARRARPGRPQVRAVRPADMSLFLAFVAIVLLAAAAGWLGFVRARRLRAGRRHALAAGLSRRACGAVGGDSGAARARRLGAGPAPAGRPGGDVAARKGRRCPTSPCSANRSCPKRARSPAAQARGRLQPRERGHRPGDRARRSRASPCSAVAWRS